ncbi:HAD family hydrolase [Paenibacillus lautus]|uniref:HAD family hydrolase n=1 Tax=Paenibacillus lautus TaxID=1401 RepID=A0A385TUQ0_PAELA|nr:HAD family hydrolase [Paenibacillus lautus]
MNKQYEQVREFHKAFDQWMPDKPMLMSKGENPYHEWVLRNHSNSLSMICKSMKDHKGGFVSNRASWMLEELIEFMDADTLEDQVDALTDLIYFAIGTFTLMGVKPEPFFDIVHAANMGKLHEDGKPRVNEQGKIVKPEGWAEKYAPEPKIVQELIRQSTGY